MRLLSLVLVLTLTSLRCSSLFGQTPRAANLQVGHDNWTFKDGTPEATIGLAQTPDGILWLGAPTGLFRFDGSRFQLFHSPFGDKLLSTNIYALFAPPSGGLWVGYVFGGFSFLVDGRVTNYGGEVASSTGSVFNFAQDRDGIVWAATSSGLWRFEHSSWQHLGAEWNVPLGSVGEVRFDRGGTLWILTGAPGANAGKQLFYLSPGTRKLQAAGTNLTTYGFTLDPDGQVVTSAASKPPVRDSSSNSDDGPLAYPLFTKNSLEMVDRIDNIWIETPRDLVLIRSAATGPIYDTQRKASRSNAETFNINPSPNARLVDREGNIWFADPKGIHRFFYSPLIKQELPKKSARFSYFSVVPDDHGAVWIENTLSLYRVSSGTVELRKSTPDLDSVAYRALDRTFWFGGDGGLWHLVGGNLVQVDLPREMADQAGFLQTITQDRLGGMWVSFGRHGLYRFANGVWTPYGGREGLPKTGVVIEFTDSLGRVWFGYTRSTLALLDGNRVQVFGPSDGLRMGNVTAISGRGSEIWIGGEFGLQQFDHGRFHKINAVDDEWLRGISGIVETANGDLWLNGLGGILHVRRSEISEALKNPAYQVKGKHFGMREGLPGLAFQLRPLNTAMEGTDGRLWFTGNAGVVWLDPTQSESNIPPPPISIQSVSADDKFYAPVSPLKFPAGTSSVQINYAAVSLSDPEAIRFRYKLQETDKDWHEVSSANPVSYRNLAPGSYHFSVAATDTNGVWSDKVATEEFTILPAFYQTRWFLALCILTAMALLYLLYLLRLKQATQQVRAGMEARLAERERIARDLHDTLLQSFQGLLLRFQAATNLLLPGEAKQRFESAIEQAAEAITEGRDAVQGLRSSTVVTNDLACAIGTLGEELATSEANPNPAAFDVDVEGASVDLHPILRDEVYRIAGEAVRNAFRHAQARRIEVEIRYDERQFRLRVRDDGKGIDPKLPKEGGRPGHYGLRGMRERARLLGGKLVVWSKRDSGTEVELSIPASRAYEISPARRRYWLAEKLSGKDTGAKS